MTASTVALSGPGPSLAADGPLPNGALWYLDRGTGVVSLLLLTAVVAVGVLVRRGGTVAGLPRFVVAGLHRNLSLLTLVLLAGHVTTSVVDPYAPIRPLDAVVPLASDYRPLWLGLGAGALDLLLAVVVTSLLRLRIGLRAWRAVHWSTFAVWPVALLHGLGTGSDIRSAWMLALCAGCLAVVLVAVLWRITTARHLDPWWRAALVGLTVAAPVLLAGWLVVGPLAPGWAARSGTPQALVAHATVGQAARASAGVVMV